MDLAHLVACCSDPDEDGLTHTITVPALYTSHGKALRGKRTVAVADFLRQPSRRFEVCSSYAVEERKA